jgi:radical SAM protein with 4Fe4S-binding SPASM domain
MKKVNVNYNEIVFSKEWEKYRGKDYFEYRKAWGEFPEKRIVSDFPLHLDIETTDLCNLKCPMCSRTIMDEAGNQSKKNRFISKEEYIKIIDEGVKYGLKSIKLQYLGEPLLDPNIIFFVKYAKEKGIVDVLLNTNATLLTKELALDLLEAGIDKIFISIDAINPKLYEQQRVGATLGKVIDNTYELVKLRNEKFPKTHIRVSMVMYDDEIWKRQFEGLKIMWENLVDAVGYGVFNDRKFKSEHEKVDGFVCEQLFQRMFLRCNGNVTVCCVDDREEYIVGNWRKDSLYDIWHNKKYKYIRERHINNKYDEIPMCKKCRMPLIYKEENGL